MDSSAWIEALKPRGRTDIQDAIASLARANEARWCHMVRVELWNGVRGPAERRHLELLDETIPLLDINDDVWTLSAHLALKAVSSGLNVKATDIIIAATALHHGARLLHCDAHLERLLEIV
ncbi:MAG: PIN domain-containing protein [Tepidisphaeraceae bacterium]